MLLVARSVEKLEETKAEIERRGGYGAHPPLRPGRRRGRRADGGEVLAYHGHVDILVNNAGRSIRRSVALSYDRFHDYERTIQLNYLGALRLILALLPSMRARKLGPHHQRQLDRDADQPAALLRLRRLEGSTRRLQPRDRLRGQR